MTNFGAISDEISPNEGLSVSFLPRTLLTHFALMKILSVTKILFKGMIGVLLYDLFWLVLDPPLRWRHNEHDGDWNHQLNDCLLNRLCRRRSKETSKLHVTGLCAGNSPGPVNSPTQRASNAENVSIWWRHHAIKIQRETSNTLGIGVGQLEGCRIWPHIVLILLPWVALYTQITS